MALPAAILLPGASAPSIARTILIDIHLQSSSNECVSLVLKELDEQLGDAFSLRRVQPNSPPRAHPPPGGASQLYVYVYADNMNNDRGSGLEKIRQPDDLCALLRVYPSKKLASLTFEESSASPERALTNEDVENVRRRLATALEMRVVRVPSLKRGTSVPNYYATVDERVIEFDFDAVLFEQQSKYQNVKILRSPTLGVNLFLDDLQNLGECDISYTHGLMNFGEVSYTGKEILILGGGDGGLLHELLKEKPKFVTMVDIDDVVMQACRQHLRGVCGNVLDTYDGPNYQIIVGDCLEYLARYINAGRTFDAVFSDLTDIPICAELGGLAQQSEQWEFLSKVLRDSLKLMRIGSVFQNHATGRGCVSAQESYEKFLSTLPNTHFTKRYRYVPSFYEDWVFYSIYLDR